MRSMSRSSRPGGAHSSPSQITADIYKRFALIKYNFSFILLNDVKLGNPPPSDVFIAAFMAYLAMMSSPSHFLRWPLSPYKKVHLFLDRSFLVLHDLQ